MKRILLNNIKYWVHDNKPYNFIRGRNVETKERETICAYGFTPRFFAKTKDVERFKFDLENSIKVKKIEKYKKVPNSIYKEPVSLIHTYVPKDVRDSYNEDGVCQTILGNCETFQSRIPFELTFMIWSGIKSGIEYPDKPRGYINGFPAYFWKDLKPFDDFTTQSVINPVDIEIYYFRGDEIDLAKPDREIIAITMKQFGRDHVDTYIYDPETPQSNEILKELKGATNFRYNWQEKEFKTEKQMLNQFIGDFITYDADINTAWNSNYDFGYIINRCKVLGVNYKRLSPYAHFMDRPVYVRKERPVIAGRTIMDEMHVYMEHTKFEGKKHSYSLEYTAQNEVGAGKIKHKETTGELLSVDKEKLKKYNAIDVELVELIAKRKNLWGFLERVRRGLGIPIEKSMSISVGLHSLYVRKSMERGMAFPIRNFELAKQYRYKGAVVFDPTPGVCKDVVSYDFKALYAYIISMWNMSLETLIKNPLQEKKDYLDTCIRTPGGLYFRPKSEELGFITGIVEDFIREGDETKTKLLRAFDKYGPDDPMVEDLELEYAYLKSNRNSVYGTFKLYSIPIARDIAAIARLAIIFAKKIAESKKLHDRILDGFDLETRINGRYGDTDSSKLEGINPRNERLMDFVGDNISELMSKLTDTYNVKENNFIFRPEKAYESFFMMDKKKKYIGHVVKELKESVAGAEWRTVDKWEIVGIEKSDISILSNRGFEEMLKQICYSANHKFDLWTWIHKHILDYKRKFYDSNTDLFDICPTTEIRKKIENYGKTGDDGILKGVPSHVKGAVWSNEYFGTDFRRGDRISELYIKGKSDSIALPEGFTTKDLNKYNIYVDRTKMFKKQILKKFNEAIKVLGFDIDELHKGQRQAKII